MDPTPQPRHTRAWLLIGIGAALALAGVLVTIFTFGEAEIGARRYLLAWGPLLLGIAIALRGVTEVATYRSFVAWRYLLIPHPKVTRATKIALVALVLGRVAWWAFTGAGISVDVWSSKDVMSAFDVAAAIDLMLVVALTAVVFFGVLVHTRAAMWCFLFGAILAVLAWFVVWDVGTRPESLLFGELRLETRTLILAVAYYVRIGGGVFAFLAMFFGSLRAFFTFYATVPIGGVWIGTAALVVVLSVMSGFENDLRDNILGSNAHIQVTREDGEFANWREVKERIDAIPGVIASTPYATSEVVIAAHNNGMNVIIKGIDPATVGKVTDLVSDLEDPEALERLEPLVDDSRDLSVPPTPAPDELIDPPPPDMPSGGEPIDFSGAGAERAGAAGAGPSGTMQLAPPIPYDEIDAALGLQDDPAPADVVDPAPSDLLSVDAPPADFSEPSGEGGGDEELPIEVIDSFEPIVSRRTQSLPGVLVGRELVKQTHLYTGEEVRIVSPLSDPSNPDATGTPIPFNRDFRVAGTFFTGMYEYDLKYVYVTLESLQDFLDLGDTVDGIEVRIYDPEDTERFVPTEAGPGLIRQALGPGYRVTDWRELNRSLFSALKLEKIAMFLVLGIVILVASFSIVGNLIMVVVEKGREIALLKTLGASDVGIMQLFAIQGMMIGLIGTVLGVATGLVVCWVFERFGVPINPDVYYIDKLPVHVDPQSVAASAAAGILISIAATLYPALLGARVRPAAGMRH